MQFGKHSAAIRNIPDNAEGRVASTASVADMKRWLVDDSMDVIRRLALVAEYRDKGGAFHIMRIGHYCHLMARRLGFSEDNRQMLFYSSMLHDIGKISVPLRILLKPSGLNPEEFEIVKSHTILGRRLLNGQDSEFIRMAERIILTHHERWDGSGYPNGLKGDEIPVEGKLVNIADQYDALRSMRPYKSDLSHEKTFKIMTEGDGRTMPGHFDPEMLHLFMNTHMEFARIYEQYEG